MSDETTHFDNTDPNTAVENVSQDSLPSIVKRKKNKYARSLRSNRERKQRVEGTEEENEEEDEEEENANSFALNPVEFTEALRKYLDAQKRGLIFDDHKSLDQLEDRDLYYTIRGLQCLGLRLYRSRRDEEYKTPATPRCSPYEEFTAKHMRTIFMEEDYFKVSMRLWDNQCWNHVTTRAITLMRAVNLQVKTKKLLAVTEK
jgi:hypothetical protein